MTETDIEASRNIHVHFNRIFMYNDSAPTDLFTIKIADLLILRPYTCERASRNIVKSETDPAFPQVPARELPDRPFHN